MDLKKWKIFADLSPGFAAKVKSVYIIGIDGPQNSIGTGGQEMPQCRAGLMVMKNDDVYSVVRTSDDLLMLGLPELEGLSPLVPVKIDDLCGLGIRAVSSGLKHAAVLTMDGRVYEWGTVFFEGQWKLLRPKFISGNLEGKKVIQVACGRVHTVALTLEGEVHAWGSDELGQVGCGFLTTFSDPAKISGSNGFDSKIVSIACGGWTSFALDDEGNVWSWGCRLYYPLGFATPGNQPFPRKIPGMNNIEKVVAGKHHVLALSNNKEVYFWGQHTLNEGGVETPKKLEIPNVVDIGVVRGCSLSAFKTTENKVYFRGFAYGHLIPEPVRTEFSSLEELFASLDTPVMLMPVQSDLKQPESVIEKLRRSFDDQETGDVKFDLEGKCIHAHKHFLKLRSDHFKCMFDNNWKENNDEGAVVEISGFSYPAFRTFLFYLYTDLIEPVPCTVEAAIELFKLGDYYGEDNLKRCCETYLKLLITTENFDQVYSLAVQYSAKALLNIVLDIVIPNFNKIVKSEGYKKMPDELKIRLTEEIADENAFAGMKRMARME